LIRDRDSKYSGPSMASSTVKASAPSRTLLRSPKANAIAEPVCSEQRRRVRETLPSPRWSTAS